MLNVCTRYASTIHNIIHILTYSFYNRILWKCTPSTPPFYWLVVSSIPFMHLLPVLFSLWVASSSPRVIWPVTPASVCVVSLAMLLCLVSLACRSALFTLCLAIKQHGVISAATHQNIWVSSSSYHTLVLAFLHSYSHTHATSILLPVWCIIFGRSSSSRYEFFSLLSFFLCYN